MLQVPIEALPNQSFSITLDESFYEFTIKEIGGVMGVTIVRDTVTLVSNVVALAAQPLIPYRYLEDGNFVFTNENEDGIYYDQFGFTQSLLYLSAAELAAVRT